MVNSPALAQLVGLSAPSILRTQLLEVSLLIVQSYFPSFGVVSIMVPKDPFSPPKWDIEIFTLAPNPPVSQRMGMISPILHLDACAGEEITKSPNVPECPPRTMRT